MRGIAPQLVAAIVGALVGVMAAFFILSQLKIESDYEVYASGFSLLSLPYRNRLLGIYAGDVAGEIEKRALLCFLSRGGPPYCGEIWLGDSKVSVWVNQTANCDYRTLDREYKRRMEESAWENCEKSASEEVLSAASALLDIFGYVQDGMLVAEMKKKISRGKTEIPLVAVRNATALKIVENALLNGNVIEDECRDGQRVVVRQAGNATVAQVLIC